MFAIEIDHLRKSYSHHIALNKITIRIRQGEVYGLLGPNGAGKTTLLQVLLGFLKPSGGQVRLFGRSDRNNMRHRIGYLPEMARYRGGNTPEEYLRFLGRLSDMSGTWLQQQVWQQLHRVGLESVADRPIASFSRSMLQRMGIAQALLAGPDLLLLDEPISGLDSAGQRDMLELLADMRSQGYTMLICSHYLEQVEPLCDRIGLIANGRLVGEVSAQHLRVPAGSIKIQVTRLEDDLQSRLRMLSSAIYCDQHSITLSPNGPDLQSAVLRLLIEAGVPVLAIDPMERPLEKMYLQFVNQQSSSGRANGPPFLFKRSVVIKRPLRQDELAEPASSHDPLLDELLIGRTPSESSKAEPDDRP
ncbi:MAG: ABC transporter ATP-binding protein [Chloroflexaceae bacterium]|nr:ABC transporter ATP-binding protein [Chloroflexaceae bacterium]